MYEIAIVSCVPQRTRFLFDQFRCISFDAEIRSPHRAATVRQGIPVQESCSLSFLYRQTPAEQEKPQERKHEDSDCGSARMHDASEPRQYRRLRPPFRERQGARDWAQAFNTGQFIGKPLADRIGAKFRGRRLAVRLTMLQKRCDIDRWRRVFGVVPSPRAMQEGDKYQCRCSQEEADFLMSVHAYVMIAKG